MDALLARLGVQAVNYAIRSGIAITSSYAIQQCSRLLKTVDDKVVHAELKTLQGLLNSKIKIISPAIDLIEFKSGRGNVFLESAIPLAKSLHKDIVSLGKRLENAAIVEEGSRLSGGGSRTPEHQYAELMRIISDIKSLLARIDQDIPLIQLAISASGESLSTSMPLGISPSRLMQASTFLTIGDTQYANDPTRPVQIGPSFTLSIYMLFLGHSSKPAAKQEGSDKFPSTPENKPQDAKSEQEEPYGFREGDRKPIWQEVIHKARVRLCRTPLAWAFDPNQGYCPILVTDLEVKTRTPSESANTVFGKPNEFSYHLEIIEDLNDGRVHDNDDPQPHPYDDISMAGIRVSIPIHQIAKIFYTDTGKLLNIGNSDGENSSVLLLKRDTAARSPSRLREEWEEESLDCDNVDEDTRSSTIASDDQDDVDRQLREESHVAESIQHQESGKGRMRWHLPQHLDREWLALEVYTEDNDEGEEDEDEDEDANGTDSEPSDGPSHKQLAILKPRLKRDRSSLDSNLLEQIRNISLRSPPAPRNTINHVPQPSPGGMQKEEFGSPESFVARSPFGAITSSLSLMEMLIRLTSLQEFQQTSHLAIPDHILTFFLEETSTTGLQGEQRWRARNEAKRKVGFDPYTDTPTR